jgi:hypothetical protein
MTRAAQLQKTQKTSVFLDILLTFRRATPKTSTTKAPFFQWDDNIHRLARSIHE